MNDLRGQQLGNYRLLRGLGQGGFADVYLGEHIHLQTQAAIKVLQTRVGSNDVQSFSSEARTIANLEHPNIVRVLDFGVEGATPFLVMTYAPHGTLRQRIPKGTQLPLDLVVSKVKQVVGALQYAHTQRVIHRDIKPENMLLGRNHEVLLSDFGIALIAQSSRYQHTEAVIGTAAYMAPEQLQGRPLLASDQYALGIVVYEWLSGMCPFQGSFIEIYSQHVNVAPPPLREKLPGISSDVEQVVQRALAKNPSARFNTVQAFADALEQASTPTRVKANSPTYLRNPSFPSLPLPPTQQASTQSTKIPALPSQLPSQPMFYPSLPLPPTQQASTSPVRSQWTSVPLLPPQRVQPTRKSSGGRRLRTFGLFLGAILLLGVAFTVFHSFFPVSPSSQPRQQSNSSSSPSASLPTSIPTPGIVLYKANWSTGSDHWVGAPQWKPTGNGELGSDGSGTEGFITWAPIHPSTANYAVEATIQFVRVIEHGYLNTVGTSGGFYEFGIMLRGNGGGDGYEGGVEYLSGSGVQPVTGTVIANVQNDNLNSDNSDQGLDMIDSSVLQSNNYSLDNNPHTYRVEVTGNDIKFLLDGTLLLETTDNSYPNGQVGLRAAYAELNVSSFKVIACSSTSCP